MISAVSEDNIRISDAVENVCEHDNLKRHDAWCKLEFEGVVSKSHKQEQCAHGRAPYISADLW